MYAFLSQGSILLGMEIDAMVTDAMVIDAMATPTTQVIPTIQAVPRIHEIKFRQPDGVAT